MGAALYGRAFFDKPQHLMYGNANTCTASAVGKSDKPQHLMYGNSFVKASYSCIVSDKPQHLMYGNSLALAILSASIITINLNI